MVLLRPDRHFSEHGAIAHQAFLVAIEPDRRVEHSRTCGKLLADQEAAGTEYGEWLA